MKPILLLLVCLGALALSPSAEGTNFTKKVNAKVWAHIMPWFETRDSSGTGQWGIHWTMANKNPDIIDGSGKRQIAAHYYPEIGPYGSGQYETVEYQLNMMKYAGIDGVLIDWPGTVNAWDYPKNKANSEEIIRGCERLGLEFAIVYEDHNIGMAFDSGFIGDKIGAAQADMGYLKDVYMPKGNYIRVNGAPLLLDFGPQTFMSPGEWDAIFAPFGGQRPTFLTLWYQSHQANAAGEYNWIYSDFLDGLRNFYNNRPLGVKMGNAYPGFNTFYDQGGWPGPGWSLPTGLDTFQQTLNLAVQSGVPFIQLATWNDYGEGTMVEPTREFGNGFLNILQNTLGVPFGNAELETVKKLHSLRVMHKNDKTKNAVLDIAARHLADLKPQEAAQILNTL
ncbi:unnamed protein product [Allacma fusca]|uniref:Uncharacterized protein n=2 Tax=Allacma fusca TaxID=39272 RepID=A0A8J2K8X0_9HEXA|nr:unnamed protein product [Allacma fusca]